MVQQLVYPVLPAPAVLTCYFLPNSNIVALERLDYRAGISAISTAFDKSYCTALS
jgi:poly-gamma-glutamate capsule biosynthesis protein CapA/YwtB (metallophosphatase superfamily)